MRVLVTGHRGYIGSVMTAVLKHSRFDVVGLDCDWYAGCDFGRVRSDSDVFGSSVPSFDADVRDITFADLLSFDAIIHLAALPEDEGGLAGPDAVHGCCCGLPDRPTLIERANYEATMHLAECARQAGVSRFLFASTCAVYGRRGVEPFDEGGPTNPLTAHAATKLRCEHDLARMADDRFSPVFLRHGEVYGVSPRLRLDLVVNGLVGSAVTHGRVAVRGGARGWRPVVHVEDLCRAYVATLLAPDRVVSNEVFNVVPPDENYRVIDIADMIADVLPLCTRSAVLDMFDGQSFRADGSKLARTFPNTPFRWPLRTGLRQLHTAMLGAGVTPTDWRSDRYRRMSRLQHLFEAGRLDASFRPTRSAEQQYCLQ